MTLDLGIPDPEPRPALSAGARLSARLRDMAAAGVNPLTYEPGHPTKTCGTCAHRVDSHRRYPKCDHPETPRTSGPATDVRAYWPACPRHTPNGT